MHGRQRAGEGRREEELKGLRISVGLEVFLKAYFETERRYGMPVPHALDVPSRVRTIVLSEDHNRVYANLAEPGR